MLANFPLDQASRILAAFALVLIAALVSRWQEVDLEKDILTASVRAFVQLVAIGYALTFVFAIDSPLLILAILSVMISIAGYTAGKRGRGVPHAGRVALLSIACGASLTLGLLVALGVFEFTASQIIPIAGHGDRQFDERLLAGDGAGAG